MDERVVPPLDEARDDFLLQIRSRRVAVAESTFVADVVEAADVAIEETTFETIRQLAAEPQMELSSRALGRALVRVVE